MAKRRSGLSKDKLKMTRNQRRKAAYKAMAEASGNSKQYTGESRKKQKLVRVNDHQAGQGTACQNIGCKRCNPKHYNMGLRRNGYRLRNEERRT